MTDSAQPPARFGFIVHPLTRFQRRMFGVRSGNLSMAVGRPSRVASRPQVIARIGLTGPFGQSAEGVLVGIPELPRELLESQASGVESVTRAVALCHNEGAQIVGLGAVAAVIGGQGKAVARDAPCPVSTGNGLTAMAAVETLERLEAVSGRHDQPVGLLGPPGPVASGILRALAARGRTIRVIATNPPKPLLRLAQKLSATATVEFVDSPTPVLTAGQVLIAASSTGGRLRLSELPPKSIVIDVAAPQDVLVDTRRNDVLLLDGEYIRLPSPLAGSAWRAIYGLVTGQDRHIFACYAEPMLFALTGRTDLCSVGRSVPLDRIEALADLAAANGFFVDRLYSHGRPVDPAQLRRFIV